MIIIIFSETTEHSVQQRLGEAEYSYYFVLKEFRPVLETLGRVVRVSEPLLEVDPIYDDAVSRNEPCVFLSFSAPHYRTPTTLRCPAIPVFAWEFDTLPSETWYCEREQDWRFVLNKLGRAITHSTHTVETIRSELGQDFPVTSIPAPLWDRFAHRYRKGALGIPAAPKTLAVVGDVFDTRGGSVRRAVAARLGRRSDIEIDGVVYLSIFNPSDGRKNAIDMIGAFCEAFRDIEDATLVLKLTNRDLTEAMQALRNYLRRLMPFKCRVLLLAGYLDGEMYERLVATASFAVNASHAEGQCLPLMEMMACGKPAIAPCHTGMADYVTDGNAFVVRSTIEPTCWPHDPRLASRTRRHRIDYESLLGAYRESYRVAKEEPERYAAMAEHAHEASRRHCSHAVARERLSEIIAHAARPALAHPDFGRIKPRVDAPWAVENYENFRVMTHGAELDSLALSLARLGAQVDVVSSTRSFTREMHELARRHRVALTPSSGQLGFNPAGLQGVYDLIFFCDTPRHRALLPSAIPALRAMLSATGKVLMTGRPVLRTQPRMSLRNLRSVWDYEIVPRARKWCGYASAPDHAIRQFEEAGFRLRQYGSYLNGQTVPMYEFNP